MAIWDWFTNSEGSGSRKERDLDLIAERSEYVYQHKGSSDTRLEKQELFWEASTGTGSQDLLRAALRVYEGDESRTFAAVSAARFGRVENLKICQKEGVDFEAPLPGGYRSDYEGKRPVDVAFERGMLREFDFLLKAGSEHGADLSFARVYHDRFPLDEFTSFVEGIKEEGGLENRYSDGNTMLHAAARARSTMMINTLIEAGADVNAKNEDGNTPMHLLVHAESLVDRYAYDSIFENEPAYSDAKYGVYNGSKVLVNAGADINAKNNEGKTPLDVAIDTSLRDKNFGDRLVNNLINEGADVLSPGPDGMLPFDKVMKEGRADLGISMLESGVDFSGYEKDLVIHAVRKGSPDLLKGFTQGGIDWKEKIGGDQIAFLAVDFAKEENSVKPIETLEALGVNFQVRNDNGDTPLSFAKEIGCRDDVVNHLVEMKREAVRKEVKAAAAASVEKTGSVSKPVSQSRGGEER